MKTENNKRHKRDEELKEDILESRRSKEGKTKLEQDNDEPIIGEEKIDTDGFNSGNESTPEGKGGEGQAASSVPNKDNLQNKKRQNGE